ncbi:hypothetical protein GCM10027449_04830 [Sinomonas notoginsengisoli]
MPSGHFRGAARDEGVEVPERLNLQGPRRRAQGRYRIHGVRVAGPPNQSILRRKPIGEIEEEQDIAHLSKSLGLWQQ